MFNIIIISFLFLIAIVAVVGLILISNKVIQRFQDSDKDHAKHISEINARLIAITSQVLMDHQTIIDETTSQSISRNIHNADQSIIKDLGDHEPENFYNPHEEVLKDTLDTEDLYNMTKD